MANYTRPGEGGNTPSAIADRLEEEIAAGRFSDGDPLPQDMLAARFGVSKIPIREGLRMLEAQGLVAFLPNRGVVVAGTSPDEANEIVEMRVALETGILKKAVARFTAYDVRRATRLLEDLDDERVAARQSALNWEFHAAVYAPAARPRQLAVIRGLHVLVDRYMRLVLSGLKHQRRSQLEHWSILEACTAGQGARAATLLTAHITYAGELMVRHLRDRDARRVAR